MGIDPLMFVVSNAVTGNPSLSLVVSSLGRNPAAVALLAAGSQQRRDGGGISPPPPTPRRVEVPELPDDQDEAKEVLRGRGLVPAVEAVASETPIDGVIGSDPPAETIVRIGSTVTILVSAGLEVPDVKGKEVGEAEETLKNAGFEVEQRESEHSGKEGTVEEQDPQGGTFADAHSTVTLTVFPAQRMRQVSGGKQS